MDTGGFFCSNAGKLPQSTFIWARKHASPGDDEKEMKAHLILELQEQTPSVDAPHWQDILTDKSQGVESLHPSVDALLRRHRLPVWVTRAYRPADQGWSVNEIASGMDRIYRLILQRNGGVPLDLLREISLLPVVREVHVGQIGQADLPPMHVTQLSADTDRECGRRRTEAQEIQNLKPPT
jgi:hypothetical protein